MRTLACCIVVLLLALGSIDGVPAVAQEEAAIRLMPRVGYQGAYAGSLLWTTRAPETEPGEFVPNVGAPVDMSESFVLGLSLEMDLPVRWLAFRASVDRTLGADLVEESTVTCGEECVGVGTRSGTQVGGVTRWSLSTDVVFQPVPRTWPVRPFAAFGTGVDRYGFDEEVEVRPEFRPGAGDRWTASVHLGFGVDTRIAGRTIRSEIAFRTSERDRVRGWEVQEFGEHRFTLPLFIPVDQDVAIFMVGLRVPLR